MFKIIDRVKEQPGRPGAETLAQGERVGQPNLAGCGFA
jgi:hypothetical protein